MLQVASFEMRVKKEKEKKNLRQLAKRELGIRIKRRIKNKIQETVEKDNIQYVFPFPVGQASRPSIGIENS